MRVLLEEDVSGFDEEVVVKVDVEDGLAGVGVRS